MFITVKTQKEVDYYWNKLVKGGQEHRHHQADEDGANLVLRQRRRRRDRRRVADIDDLGRDVRELAGNFV